MMRRMLGVAVGIVLANLIVFGGEWLLPQLPFAGAVDAAFTADPEYADRLSFAAQLWLAGVWTAGPLAGALAAFMIGRSDWTGWVVAGVMGGIGAANAMFVAYPFRLMLWAIAAPFVGALVGFGLYRRWRAARLHLR